MSAGTVGEKVLELILMMLAGIVQGLRQDFNFLELAVLLIAWWAIKKRNWRPRWWSVPTLRRPALVALSLALGTILLRLALIPLLPVPDPRVTDEHSHLLLADTLLHGRLANPTHPFWQHFESLHILLQPHYVSNYFPGQALWLAAGTLVLHSPWSGVLAECFVFLLVLYWMQRGFLPQRWALFGCLLAALRLGIGSYWINAFHGGFLPAIGGALVLGAYARLSRRFSWLHSLALAAGLATLMVSRPFEGAFFAIPPVLGLIWQYRSSYLNLARTGAVVTVVLALTGAGLGVYFKAITGSPLVTAYQISQKTYGWPMTMAWAKPPRIEHQHLELAQYYQYEYEEREKVGDPVNFVEYLPMRVQEYWRFFLGPVLTLPVILYWRRLWKRRKMVLLALGAGFLAVMLEGAASPHYFAAATGPVFLLLADCCRRLRAGRIFSPLALPAAMAAVLVIRIGAGALGLPYSQKVNYQSWCCRVDANGERAKITARLNQIPGRHLVFVKPKQDPFNFEQWIYNAADIDASPIVWARDLGAERNRQLANYYPSRSVWLVDPNVMPPVWTRYPQPQIAKAP